MTGRGAMKYYVTVRLLPYPFCGKQPMYSRVYDGVKCETPECALAYKPYIEPAKWNHRTRSSETPVSVMGVEYDALERAVRSAFADFAYEHPRAQVAAPTLLNWSGAITHILYEYHVRVGGSED